MRRAISLIAVTLTLAGAGCEDTSVASRREKPSALTTSSGGFVPNTQGKSSQTPPDPTDPNEILSVLSVEHQVDVATQLDGLFVSIAKDDGNPVIAGEILGQLDDRLLQIELVKARNDLQVAEDNVKYKEAEVKAKGANYRRQQQLHSLGLSSEVELENAEFEAKGAEFDLQATQALVDSAQAEIHRLEIQIDQTRLRAPFSGVVVHRYVREGQTVAKQDKCFRVSQLAPLQVLFQVAESSAPRPERGALVPVFLVGDSKRPLKARVVKVSPVIDPAGDSYDVTAELSGIGLSDLRPGMAVRVRWSSAAHQKP